MQIYEGCCRIVDQRSGDSRTFVFHLRRGDYSIGTLTAENGEHRPLPIQPVPVHLDHDQDVALHGALP